MFAHLTLRMSARRCTIMFVKPSTETIVIKHKEMSKSPMKKMFALIKMFQSATNIGSVTIQIHPCQVVTTKSGLTIRNLANISKKTVCNKVQKYRTVKQPYRKCDKESWQDCNDVPYQQCNPVTKQRCEDVPYNDCQKVPYQACQPVHKLVKEQVSQKRPFRVCTGVNEPYKYTNQEIEDYDFIELRTGATDSDVGSPVDNGLTEDDPNRDVEQITTKKPPKSSDAIIFG